MSAASSCDCPCETPVVVQIPGSAGTPGADGADGANGISAFTVLTTANLVVSVPSDTDVISVGVSSWASVNQVVIISGLDNGVPPVQRQGHFLVTSVPTSTSLEITFLGYDGDSTPAFTIVPGATVSPSGTQPSGPTAIANGGTGAITATLARAALGVGGAGLSVYAAGTAYQLTATPALLNFGTTDPSLTINAVGTWLILARARIDYNAKTTAAVRTITLKLRRTNNTAADIANSSTAVLTEIVTTLTYTLESIALPPIIYTTTNANDVIEVWGSADDIAGAGTFDATEAAIVAIKLFDQTL